MEGVSSSFQSVEQFVLLARCVCGGGAMFDLERIVPVMVLMVVMSWVSTWCVWADLDQTGVQYC